MSESKILQNFFEEQHRKFKEKTYSLLRFIPLNHVLHSDRKEWLKQKAEAESLSAHPFRNPPPDEEKSSGVE
ncbi:MAG TPA: hypothetical protein VIJ93_11695 [bacterium]